MPYQRHQIFFLRKIWVINNSKHAANITWRVYWMRNNCLVLSTFCTFQNPIDHLNQWCNGLCKLSFSRIVWTLAGFEESWRIAGERSSIGRYCIVLQQQQRIAMSETFKLFIQEQFIASHSPIP